MLLRWDYPLTVRIVCVLPVVAVLLQSGCETPASSRCDLAAFDFKGVAELEEELVGTGLGLKTLPVKEIVAHYDSTTYVSVDLGQVHQQI